MQILPVLAAYKQKIYHLVLSSGGAPGALNISGKSSAIFYCPPKIPFRRYVLVSCRRGCARSRIQGYVVTLWDKYLDDGHLLGANSSDRRYSARSTLPIDHAYVQARTLFASPSLFLPLSTLIVRKCPKMTDERGRSREA
jgi:hypothetical protein